MSTFRLALVAVGLFALTFVGISWASKAFPVMAMRVEPLKPDARIPAFEESVQKGLRQDWESSKASQSDGDEKRDRLRLELLQASNGYKLSPCDGTMKKNLVEALTNYMQAWSDMAFCKPGVGNCPGTYSARIDAAAAAFKTPADVRVHKALREAINQGGVAAEDFPSSIRKRVFIFSGVPFDDDPKAACIVARQAQNRQ